MTLLKATLLPLTLLFSILLGNGWLGVFLKADEQGRPAISEVVPNSPAEGAGLKAGDVFLAVDDDKTADVESFQASIKKHDAGQKVKIVVLRDGEKKGFSVKLGRSPEAGEESGEKPESGKQEGDKDKPAKVDVGQAKNEARSQGAGEPRRGAFLGVQLEDEDEGVRVAEVVPNSPASRAGLQSGDYLKSIAGTKVASGDEVRQAMSKLRPDQKIHVRVQRGNEERELGVVVAASPGAAPMQESRGLRVGGVSGAGKDKEEDEGDEGDEGMEGGKAAKQAEKPAKLESNKPPKATKTSKNERAEKSEKAERAETETVAKSDSEMAARSDKGEGSAAARSGETGFASNLEQAMRQARQQHQPVLLVFGASWDSSSRALHRAFQDHDLQAVLEHYAKVWVDSDKQSDLADKYGVQGLPHIVVLDPSGKVLQSMEGYYPPAILREHLQKLGGHRSDNEDARQADQQRREQEQEARAMERQARQKALEARQQAHKEAEQVRASAAQPGNPGRGLALRGAPADRDIADLQQELARLRAEINDLKALIQKLVEDKKDR